MFTKDLHSHLSVATGIVLNDSIIPSTSRPSMLEQKKSKIKDELGWHLSEDETDRQCSRAHAATRLRTMLSFLHKAANELTWEELARQATSGLEHLFRDEIGCWDRINVTEFTKSKCKEVSIQIPDMNFGKLFLKLVDESGQSKIDKIWWFDTKNDSLIQSEINLDCSPIRSVLESKISELSNCRATVVND